MKFIIYKNKLFKQIRFNENYYISRDGEVFSNYSKNILKPALRGKKNKMYYSVDINTGYKQKHFYIHKLVFDTWIRNIEEGEQINHKDDNIYNNNVENLYSGNQKENIKDCVNNNHRVGNMYYLTVLDRKENKIITFCPPSDFIAYSGHPCNNKSVNRMFSKRWFKKRYEIIEFKRINSIDELEDVTTIHDECSEVGQILSLPGAHCCLKKQKR